MILRLSKNFLAALSLLAISAAAAPVPPYLFVASGGTHSVNQYNAFSMAPVDITSGGSPYGLAVGPNGNVFVSIPGEGVLEYSGVNGALIQTFIKAPPITNSAIAGYNGVTFGPDGNLYMLYQVSSNGSAIAQYDGTTGTLLNSMFVTRLNLVTASAFAFGPDGNLYVCQTLNGMGDGGTQVFEFNGSSGAFKTTFVTSEATVSPLQLPAGLTWDSAGNLYVSSYSTNQVLKYNGSTGAILGVFASGGGLNSPTSLQFGPDGNLYVSSTGSQQVLRYNGATGAFLGVAIGTGLSSPVGLAFTPGLGTNSILMGSAGGSSSVELTFGSRWTATANDSFLHIASGSASGFGSQLVVFTIDPFTGTGTRTGTLTVAGETVTVTQAGTNYIGTTADRVYLPASTVDEAHGVQLAVAVDNAGDVYYTDRKGAGTGFLQEWSPPGQQVNVLVTSGLSLQNQNPLYVSSGVAVDLAGNVYIADDGDDAIKEWSPATQQLTTLDIAGLNNPSGVAVDLAGNVYIADTGNNAIKEWSVANQTLTTLVGSGLSNPMGVAVDFFENVYIADTGDNAIKEWIPAKQQLAQLVSEYTADSVAVDGSGNVYSLGAAEFPGLELGASTNQVTTIASLGWSLAVDGMGNLYSVGNGNVVIEDVNAFVGPATLTESSAAGSDMLLPVVPSTQSLSGIYAPTSSQTWLTIGTVADGVVNFSFTANTGSTPRTGSIYLLGQQITVTQQNGNIAQTITFNPPSTVTLGTRPAPLSATASPSGYTVMFTSNTPLVCTVSGTALTLLTTGACSITATQPGDATYAPATPVTQTITVLGMPQTITFGGLSDVTFINSGLLPINAIFKVSATTSSGLAVQFASTDPAVCTVGLVSLPHGLSSWEVVLQSAGTCSIVASQGGNSTWAAATPVTQPFTVNGELQTITFSLPSGNWTVGMTTQPTLTATTTSPLKVTFSSNTTSVCTVSGTDVTILTDGACSITAIQGGNATWAAASVTLTKAVDGESQTITFPATGTVLSNVPVTAPPFKVSATASSGLRVTLTSNTPTICTVGFVIVPLGPSNWYVTPQAPGTCSITASQIGNSTYAAATAVTRTLEILQTQTITFNALSNVAMGASPVSLSASASSGLPVTFASGSTSICTVTELFIDTSNGRQPLGWTAKIVAPGLCSITASQSGNSTYAAATPDLQSFTVLKTQTIKFLSPGAQDLVTVAVDVTATASSEAPVTFISNSTPICTAAQSTATSATVTLVAAGTCSITASQQGNTVYAAATPVTQTFQIFTIGAEFPGIRGVGSSPSLFIPVISFDPTLSAEPASSAEKLTGPAFSLVLADGSYTSTLIEAESAGNHFATVTVIVDDIATDQEATFTYTGVGVRSHVAAVGQDTFTFTYNAVSEKTTTAALPARRPR